MYCTSCGKEVAEGWKYCLNCGAQCVQAPSIKTENADTLRNIIVNKDRRDAYDGQSNGLRTLNKPRLGWMRIIIGIGSILFVVILSVLFFCANYSFESRQELWYSYDPTVVWSQLSPAYISAYTSMNNVFTFVYGVVFSVVSLLSLFVGVSLLKNEKGSYNLARFNSISMIVGGAIITIFDIFVLIDPWAVMDVFGAPMSIKEPIEEIGFIYDYAFSAVVYWFVCGILAVFGLMFYNKTKTVEKVGMPISTKSMLICLLLLFGLFSVLSRFTVGANDIGFNYGRMLGSKYPILLIVSLLVVAVTLGKNVKFRYIFWPSALTIGLLTIIMLLSTNVIAQYSNVPDQCFSSAISVAKIEYIIAFVFLMMWLLWTLATLKGCIAWYMQLIGALIYGLGWVIGTLIPENSTNYLLYASGKLTANMVLLIIAVLMLVIKRDKKTDKMIVQ